MVYFLVSPADDVAEWTTRYLIENRDERTAIPMRLHDLTGAQPDGWKVKNPIQQHFIAIDLFKNTLPLQSDTYFFGRQAELGSLLDSAKKVENVGLFGLRKTGKTSLLLKFNRVLIKENTHLVVMIDAQSTTIRKRRWHELLHHVATQVSSQLKFKVTHPFSEATAAENFNQFMTEALTSTSRRKAVIVVDEIEWISPSLALDRHWDGDFLSFWQAIRSFQTGNRILSVVLAGVNPFVVERDLLGGYPNPLFGIVAPVFLRGLSREETENMIVKIGKLTGLRFSQDALSFLFSKYGGHPLLTRLACSYTFEEARSNKKTFPIQVTEGSLKRQSTSRDRELLFYCRHIVSELEKFYPDEYALLELLATGDNAGFVNVVHRLGGATHLFQYGIVHSVDSPYIEYEVVHDYVAEKTRGRLVDKQQEFLFRSRIVLPS